MSSVDIHQCALKSANPPQYNGGLGIALLFGFNNNENEAENANDFCLFLLNSMFKCILINFVMESLIC